MNLNSINGSALNGARVLFVSAAASVVCTAAIGAGATRTQDALAPVPGVTTVVAFATHTQQTYATTMACAAQVQAIPKHIQQGAANASGGSTIQAFVLRQQNGGAFFTGTAGMLVIPASVLAYSNTTAFATVSATATKIHPGVSQAATAALVQITVAPTVNRFVAAGALGSCTWRVEPSINGVAWSYSNVSASASVAVADVGIVFRKASAVLDVSAVSTATPTHIHPGNSLPDGAATVVTAEPFILVGTFTWFSASAHVTSDATVTRGTNVNFDCACSISPQAVQRHASTKSTATGAAVLTPNATVVRVAAANVIQTTAEIVAQAHVSFFADASVHGSASLNADTISNADSIDPHGRTFYSPLRSTEFVRLFIETEFKRAA